MKNAHLIVKALIKEGKTEWGWLFSSLITCDLSAADIHEVRKLLGDGRDAPDWVWAVAGGNPEKTEEVGEAALSDFLADLEVRA